MTARDPTLVYCRCAYARVIDPAVKSEVLRRLLESGEAFVAVADLCEMSARRDPELAAIRDAAGNGGVRIAACYPRAVRWLFHGAGCALPDSGVEIVNMRTSGGEEAAQSMLAEREGRRTPVEEDRES